VTSLSAETGRRITVADVLPAVERELTAAFGAVSVMRTDGLPGLIPASAAG
jgi:hypothetical protein